MLQNKAYKFRIYPTKEQETLIHKTFGCARLIYNISLDKKNKDSNLSCYDLAKKIPTMYEKYPFLKEVDSCALRCAIFNLQNGLDRYYKKQNSYPMFKKKGIKESYRTNNITNTYKNKKYESIRIDLIKKVIVLPKLKEVKIRGYRHLTKIDGRILNATIKQEGYKYYVSVCVEEDVILPEKQENTFVGIDIGVKDLVITSDNEVYENPDYAKKYEKKIKGLQKGLSRKVKGSKNYYKAKQKLEEAYRKLRSARKKYVEKVVAKITSANDIIITEKLKVKSMLEKKEVNDSKSLRKRITNATFSQILIKLKDKCKMLNKTFIQVDTYYPSSQKCSRCNNIDKEMKDLSKREYKCKYCGLEIDRDINASINIGFKGICNYYKEKYAQI